MMHDALLLMTGIMIGANLGIVFASLCFASKRQDNQPRWVAEADVIRLVPRKR